MIARIGPDELVGEMALIGDQHHSATVTVSRGPAEILVVQSNDLLQAAIYDSDLVMELLALSSSRCRQTNRQLTLILEALEALDQQHSSALERCCNELERGCNPALFSAARRLKATSEVGIGNAVKRAKPSPWIRRHGATLLLSGLVATAGGSARIG